MDIQIWKLAYIGSNKKHIKKKQFEKYDKMKKIQSGYEKNSGKFRKIVQTDNEKTSYYKDSYKYVNNDRNNNRKKNGLNKISDIIENTKFF